MLRERLFREFTASRGATPLFSPGYLALAFSAGERLFAPVPIGEWRIGSSKASATVVWVADVNTVIDAANLMEGREVIERFALTDGDGSPGHARVLVGMEFEYSLIVPLVGD